VGEKVNIEAWASQGRTIQREGPIKKSDEVVCAKKKKPAAGKNKHDWGGNTTGVDVAAEFSGKLSLAPLEAK